MSFTTTHNVTENGNMQTHHVKAMIFEVHTYATSADRASTAVVIVRSTILAILAAILIFFRSTVGRIIVFWSRCKVRRTILVGYSWVTAIGSRLYTAHHSYYWQHIILLRSLSQSLYRWLVSGLWNDRIHTKIWRGNLTKSNLLVEQKRNTMRATSHFQCKCPLSNTQSRVKYTEYSFLGCKVM